MIKLLTLSCLIFGACVTQPAQGIATSPLVVVDKSTVTDIDMSRIDDPDSDTDVCEALSPLAPPRCAYILGCTNEDPGHAPKPGQCIAWVCQGVGTVGECRR